MSEQPKTDHIYDGIEEYDNPLPGWWKWLFIATIAFAPFYWVYYHSGTPGRTLQEQYNVAMAASTRLQFADLGELTADRETILQYMGDEKWVRFGESVFKNNCISCHGNRGEGSVGPNLTDEVYKNVNHIEDIATVINKGAGNGAMPQWSGRLHPNEVVFLSIYVASLRGQNLESKRPAEGKPIAPWPAATPPDETSDETPDESASP